MTLIGGNDGGDEEPGGYRCSRRGLQGQGCAACRTVCRAAANDEKQDWMAPDPLMLWHAVHACVNLQRAGDGFLSLMGVLTALVGSGRTQDSDAQSSRAGCIVEAT